MGQNLLVKEQIDAGVELARHFSEIAPVDALFWLKFPGHDDWKLCLATAKFGRGTLIEGFTEIFRLFDEHQYQWLDRGGVKLVFSTDPLALGVKQIRDSSRLPMGRYFDGEYIGGTEIEGAYIYPVLESASQPA